MSNFPKKNASAEVLTERILSLFNKISQTEHKDHNDYWKHN